MVSVEGIEIRSHRAPKQGRILWENDQLRAKILQTDCRNVYFINRKTASDSLVIRNNVDIILGFPAPVRPTAPIRSLPRISMFNPQGIKGRTELLEETRSGTSPPKYRPQRT